MSRRKKSENSGFNIWRSYSDMMCGVLLLFVLIMSVTLLQAQKSYADALKERDEKIALQEEYTAELLAVSDPGWPFGPQEGRLALKKNGWTVCEKDFTLFNDGGAMKKSNWSVTWDDEKAAVVISGQEQPDAEYYLYYVGAALRSITNGE